MTSTTSPKIDQSYSGYILACVGTLLFSTRGIATKLGYADPTADLDPITILALRMAFSLPVFITIGIFAWRQRVQEGSPLPSGLAFIQIGLVGLLGYYISSYLSFASLQYITAQVERLVLFTYPFLVMIFGWLFFGGKIRSYGLVAFALSYIGLVCALWQKLDSSAQTFGSLFLYGTGLIFLAAVTFAFYQLFAKKFSSEYGSRTYTCLAMGAAGIGVLIHFIIEKTPVGGWETLTSLSPSAYGYGIYLAIFATIIPSFMLNEALSRIGAQAVGMAGTIGPVFTIVFAIWLLGENFGIFEATGTLLVLISVGYFTYMDRKSAD